MSEKPQGFVDQLNLAYYEKIWSDKGVAHSYPNVQTVRCEKWFFRTQGTGPGKLLDYGFGTGRETIYFAENGYEVYGVEISPTAVKIVQNLIAKEHANLAPRIKLVRINPGDSKLPFDDNFFDYVHSNQVIYHLPSEAAIRQLINEWHRVLKPGGLLMFSTVGPQNTIVTKGREVEPNFFAVDYESATTETATIKAFLMRDEQAIRDICGPFQVQDIGWFTNHYCGVDGFHWQVLVKKAA